MPKQKCYPPVPLTDIRISDPFWSRYLDLVKEVMLPYQWDALNDRIPGRNQAARCRISKLPPALRKGNSKAKFFKTAMWRNGWRRPLIS